MKNLSISKEEIAHTANLARLDINDKEIEKYAAEINDIFGIIDALKKIDTDKITEKSHISTTTNRFREDIINPSQKIEDTLRNAPDVENNFIKMPKIIDSE